MKIEGRGESAGCIPVAVFVPPAWPGSAVAMLQLIAPLSFNGMALHDQGHMQEIQTQNAYWCRLVPCPEGVAWVAVDLTHQGRHHLTCSRVDGWMGGGWWWGEIQSITTPPPLLKSPPFCHAGSPPGGGGGGITNLYQIITV